MGLLRGNKNIVKVGGWCRSPAAPRGTGRGQQYQPFISNRASFGYPGNKVFWDRGLRRPADQPGNRWHDCEERPEMIGNPNPDYKTGITNSFSYKGFMLTALFDITKGGG